MSETPSMQMRIATAIGDLPPLLTRIVILLVVLVVGGIGGWIGRGALAGPADVPNMNVYQDWRLFCPDSKTKNASCEMSQDVIDQKAGQRIARLILVRDKDQNMILAVTVPLQVLLEPGMGLKIGNDQIRVYQYKTCTEEGCLSIIPVDKQIKAAFAKAQNAGIAVARPDGKAVELPFSMKGYGEAYEAFLNNEAKRKSWWRRLWS
ncbi:MAG: invasion associated locus B family protein [Rhizomicrobium sp.]